MENSKQRLIDATRELLWERGYTGTSPGDIQRRAGVGQGSMYHHFAGKVDLCAAALTASGQGLLSTAARSLDLDVPVRDKIAAYLRSERPVLRGCPIGRMTGDAEVIAVEELRAPIAHTLLLLRTKITTLIAEAQSSGELPTHLSAERIAATIIATVQGGYVLAKASGDEQPFWDAVEGVLELLPAHR